MFLTPVRPINAFEGPVSALFKENIVLRNGLIGCKGKYAAT